MLLTFRIGWVTPLLLLLSCNPFPSFKGPVSSDVSLSEHIVDKMTKAFETSAPIASLATFEWDTLYSIRRYLYPAEVRELRRELGSWMEEFEAAPMEKYKYTYLIFTLAGKVVRVAAIPDSRSYSFIMNGEEGYVKKARTEAFITSKMLYSGRSPTWYMLQFKE